MGIQRYVFFSIHNADRHPDVPLMQIKARTEEFLATSGLDFTILRLCGFMQAIIGNYAVPILEEKQVWGTSDATRTAYLDSQARRRRCLPSLHRLSVSLCMHMIRRASPLKTVLRSLASHSMSYARTASPKSVSINSNCLVAPEERPGRLLHLGGPLSALLICERQDVAKMTLAALRSDAAIGQKLTLAGPQAYTVSEVIALCERFANADADVTEVRSLLSITSCLFTAW